MCRFIDTVSRCLYKQCIQIYSRRSDFSWFELADKIVHFDIYDSISVIIENMFFKVIIGLQKEAELHKNNGSFLFAKECLDEALEYSEFHNLPTEQLRQQLDIVNLLCENAPHVCGQFCRVRCPFEPGSWRHVKAKGFKKRRAKSGVVHWNPSNKQLLRIWGTKRRKRTKKSA